ncbi:hypothetical protein MKZ38_008369 [Zalerion maritima]|uniref:Uncharacterized protein n=1 Tax=Zalerion maritima TaxID=339359 RepID=A0AAD5RUC6_9PEZI|nr:hypothetical protein MKZ38_008369 [Zalerion maritima]
MPDGQVVGTALTATFGSLIIIASAFFIYRRCGPGRPYFKKGSNDDYLADYNATGCGVNTETIEGKGKSRKLDEEMGTVLPEVNNDGKEKNKDEGELVA